jgi:hypothetical protein
MSETMNPTTTEEAEARALAERAGLEYREAGAVAVDPRALSILPAEECRRLRAVPLAASTGTAVIAVSDPNEERLQGVRQLTGPSTRFVVLTDRTLDALLRSRMFAGGASGETPDEHAPEPEYEPEPADVSRPEVPLVFGPPVAPAPQGVDGELVDAIVGALGPRLQSLVAQAAVPRTFSEHVGDSIMDPVARVDAAIEAWSSLRAALEMIGEELDASRQSLREAKEQLSVLHAENDQQQVRIDALEADVAERKSLVDEARLRLQDAAKALGPHDSDDLL